MGWFAQTIQYILLFRGQPILLHIYVPFKTLIVVIFHDQLLSLSSLGMFLKNY